MQVNMIGIAESDEIIDLASRRPTPVVDPRERETLTMIIRAMLASYATGVTPSPAAGVVVDGGDFQRQGRRDAA